ARRIAEGTCRLAAPLAGLAVAAVGPGEAGVCTIVAGPPDLVLGGVDPASGAGFRLVRSIRARMPDVEMVIVADTLQPDVVKLVMEEQLDGLLLTDMSASVVATSLDEVAHGR